MEFTVLIWVAIAIFWSVKAASEQKKRAQRQVGPSSETDERAAPRVETPTSSRNLRPAHRATVREVRRNERTDAAVRCGEAAAPETIVRTPLAAEKAAAGETPAASVAPQPTAATDGPLGEPFDLRRAILYSEILKPKFERFR